MFTLFITLAIITAFFLTLAILVQSPKEGSTGPFGSLAATQFIGLKKTSSLLERITWYLVIFLFFCSLSTSVLLKKAKKKRNYSPNIDQVQDSSMLPNEQAADLPTEPVDTVPSDQEKKKD